MVEVRTGRGKNALDSGALEGPYTVIPETETALHVTVLAAGSASRFG
ncbi:MAG: hypothetical protein RLZZ200_479, partial [Pseudomonadota bacterium]